ncbi:MAG TPA: PD-(D/E)XK motif protein [Thermoguttaceae bacterium]|nr:PD-(D/E)XK motif protein [Thermoguttaceae bacterium]
MNVGELWAELELDASSLGEDEWVVRRVNPESRCDVLLGIEGASRRRGLLVRVVNSAISGSVEYPRSRGFETRDVSLANCPRTHTTLGVLLTDPAFMDIFTRLVDDIVQRLVETTDDSESVVEMTNRLKVWQWFMEKAGTEGLRQEAQRGLYGELLFLRDYLLTHLSPLAAIQAWVGPSGGNQDFQWARRACEVKTTAAKHHQKLRIANELQLDTRAVNVLWVYHLSLDARRGSGETLPEAIDSIQTAIAHDALAVEHFTALLLESGYHPAQAERYHSTGYTVRNATFYHVTDGFPRITEDQLPNGVGDVSYSVSVTECQHFKVPASEVEQAIRT